MGLLSLTFGGQAFYALFAGRVWFGRYHSTEIVRSASPLLFWIVVAFYGVLAAVFIRTCIKNGDDIKQSDGVDRERRL